MSNDSMTKDEFVNAMMKERGMKEKEQDREVKNYVARQVNISKRMRRR